MKKNIVLLLLSVLIILPVKAYETESSSLTSSLTRSAGYSALTSCSDIDVNHIKACGCIPAGVADITSKLYFLLRIIGPILLLIIIPQSLLKLNYIVSFLLLNLFLCLLHRNF